MSFPPAERVALAGGMVAASLVPLNSTMIAVGLPDVARDLDVSRGTVASLVTAYLVAMAVCQPVAGRAGDRWGSRRVALVGLLGFGALSAAASAAPTFGALLGARVAQAIFGAALIPNVQALVRSAVESTRRGRAFGVLGAGIGAGAAAGPIIGGVLVDLAGWRSIFLVNLPVAGAALVLVGRVSVDARPRVEPAADRGALRRGPFVAACVAQATSNLTQYTILLVVPLVLDARGWSSTEIGLVLVGLTLGILVLNPIGGSMGDRHGRARPVVLGMWVLTAGAVLLTIVVGEVPALLVASLVLVGTGVGLGNASLQTAALEAVPERAVAAAAGVLSTSRYLGSITGSLAIAVLVGESGEGARLVLVLTTVAALAAVASATRIEDRPVASVHR
jgi:DHA2 family methylenomycin A resistance protein-like MFS transporter